MEETDIINYVRRAQNGDLEAFGEVVSELHAEIRGFCAMLGVQPDWLDDTCQSIFVEAYQSLERFDPQFSFRKWIRGIARNLIRRHWRNNTRERAMRESATVQVLQDHAETLSGSQQRRANMIDVLKECMERLPEHLQAMVKMRYEHRLSSDEIAEECDRTPVSVRVTLMRTREQLQQCIESRV